MGWSIGQGVGQDIVQSMDWSIGQGVGQDIV